MKLIYVYHSGYVIETPKCSIIIDYYKDSNSDEQEGFIHKHLLKKNRKLYVLSSHSHPDHFNREILKWKDDETDIKYIFSKDILENGKAKADDAVYLDKLDVYSDDILSVKAFGSTDLGVSFLISIDDKIIFHAGDLNNWHWNEESTSEEVREAETYYQNELNLLAANVQYIDLAMFPVDPRLGKDYMKGAEQFVSTIDTKIFVPMHFGNDYEKANAFSDFALAHNSKFISWKHRGESIEF